MNRLNDLETIIRLAIDFEGRTAYTVSEYDGQPLALLMSSATLARDRRLGKTTAVEEADEKACGLLEWMELRLLEEQSCTASGDEAEEKQFQLAKQCAYKAQEMVYGSRMDSKLDQYGYDMVFAATIGSIDTVLKEYMDKVSGIVKLQTKYYIETTESGKVVYREATQEEFEKLEELDLFSVPQEEEKRTEQQKAALDKAYGELFLAFGFRAAIGLPEDVDVDRILDFETGETGNHTKVKYYMYFKELSIIQFSTSRLKGYIFSNISQEKSPWAFKYNVDLGMVGVSLDSLPEKIQEKVNNIDPGQIFSISQLFMDLNTTALLDSPSVTGVSPEAKYYLDTYFLGYCVQQIKENGGDVVLGYSVTPQSEPSDKPYLLNPKDFRFYVSPYRENGQPVPEKRKLYTLNYIVICEDKVFPELREITWNWIEEKDYAYKNGAMAISKSQIYKFAQREYVKLIKKLLCTVKVSITINDPVYFHWKLGIGKDDSTMPVFENDMTYHYFQSDKDSDTFVPIWGNIEMKYDLKAKLNNYQTSDNRAILECRVDTVLWLHVNAEGGVSEGTIYDKTTWYTLTINVDEYGKLTLKPSYKEEVHNTTFSISGWSSFCVEGLEDYLEDVKNDFSGYVSDSERYWNNEFYNRYNNNSVWYIPGDGSLIFKQPAFSTNTDLTFDANYATPK